MLIDKNALAVADEMPRGDEAGDHDQLLIETRFGPMQFNRSHAIDMTRGLLGFPNVHEFGLANLPDERFQQFKLLQCLTDPGLSFLVVPIDLKAGPLQADDIDEAREALEIARDDLAILLIVTARKEEEGIYLTANLRAPVVLDTRRQIARQYVLANSEYPIRYEL